MRAQRRDELLPGEATSAHGHIRILNLYPVHSNQPVIYIKRMTKGLLSASLYPDGAGASRVHILPLAGPPTFGTLHYATARERKSTCTRLHAAWARGNHGLARGNPEIIPMESRENPDGIPIWLEGSSRDLRGISRVSRESQPGSVARLNPLLLPWVRQRLRDGSTSSPPSGS